MFDPVVTAAEDGNGYHRQHRLEIFSELHRRINPNLNGVELSSRRFDCRLAGKEFGRDQRPAGGRDAL
jgi:hypothetical protein